MDTQALLQQVGANARVQFPNEIAPTSEELARAIIALADAFAKGDADKLRPMLDSGGAAVLDELRSSGAWTSPPTRSRRCRTVTDIDAGDDAMPSGDFTTAIQEPAATFRLRWHADANQERLRLQPDGVRRADPVPCR